MVTNVSVRAALQENIAQVSYFKISDPYNTVVIHPNRRACSLRSHLQGTERFLGEDTAGLGSLYGTTYPDKNRFS